MNIHSQDQDLLLLAHGELPRVRGLATQIHVVLCPLCRRRLEKMEGASRLLADTIRGQDLSRWRLPSPYGAVAAARSTTVWLVVFALLTVATLSVVARIARSEMNHSAAVAPRVAAPSGGCRPDLPSDKCR